MPEPTTPHGHCFTYDWTCTCCPPGTPWPCEPAKAGLRVRLDPPDLRLYMTVCWRRAVVTLGSFVDQHGTVYRDLYSRFVGWTE